MRKLLLALALVFLAAPVACAAEVWTRADIYFLDWRVSTRTSLDSQRLREVAPFKRTFRADTPKIVRWLALGQLRPAPDPRPEDARLVVDLFTGSGERRTYYASRFNLCSADSASKRPIDQQFRGRIQRLAR